MFKKYVTKASIYGFTIGAATGALVTATIGSAFKPSTTTSTTPTTTTIMAVPPAAPIIKDSLCRASPSTTRTGLMFNHSLFEVEAQAHYYVPASLCGYRPYIGQTTKIESSLQFGLVPASQMAGFGPAPPTNNN